MKEQTNTRDNQDIFLETVLKVNEKAPKRYKHSKKFLKALEQELAQSTGEDSPVTDRTHRELVKIIISPIENVKSIEQAEELVSAVDELITRDPGLFHTWMDIDTEYSRERKARLAELLKVFIRIGGKRTEEHIRKEVPELPPHEAASAIAHVGNCLNLYCGEVDDVRGFVRWAWNLSVVQAKKLLFMERVYADDGSLKKCIYSGILSQLEKAKDIADYKNKDDLYYDIADLLWGEMAEEFLIPGTASLQTRLRRLAETHTWQYITSLIRRRKLVEANKHEINYGVTFSEDELRIIKAEERRAERD